ncbi:MAG TPA: ankyrin repeat domain-containing protein [Bryobacteraceae bacterium]|nr:ankyrin repeat domain-containing protein [Bryobacteraceae bacterium]
MQSNNFRLDRRRDSMPNRVGANGARIIPGNAAQSRVYLRITGQAGLQMPPTGALTAGEIALIKNWIDQGAEWPDELANEAPSTPQDSQAAAMMDALRRGDHARFEKLLKENPDSARGQGAAGVTPLMYAALYGDTRAVSELLAQGADPNTRNEAGATALLWAVDDAEATRILLEHGADPNARSADGLTPLMLAAAHLGSADVVKLLLDHGAKPEGNVLARAGASGDEAVMRLLIDRGADKRPLPNDLGMRTGCQGCVDLLLAMATKDDLNRALIIASRYGNSKAITMLLDRGATANSPELKATGAKDADPPVTPGLRRASGRTARAAVEKSLPLLQHSDVVFLRKAGCVSCHHNSLTQMTLASARKNGFVVDEAAAKSQLEIIRVYLETWRERNLQDIGIPGGIDTDSYILAGLVATDFAPDAGTDAIAIYLKRRQSADGGWRIQAQRPPIESSDFTTTAITMRALLAFAPKPKQPEYASAVKRGATWLARTQPNTTEDYVYRLLGLGWAGADKETIRKAARELMALQRPDGGWAQLPTLSSDAYASGQALTALAQAGGIAVNDPAYQRGVKFLLSTQMEDGSWFVPTRTLPVQPYFDAEFPYGHNQFISDAATNWATMALAPAAKHK